MRKIFFIVILFLSSVSYGKNKPHDYTRFYDYSRGEILIEKLQRFTSSQLLTPTKADLIEIDHRGFALVKLLEGKYKNQLGYIKLKGIGKFQGLFSVWIYIFSKDDPVPIKVYLHASHRGYGTEMGIVAYEDVPEIRGIIEHSDDVNSALYYRGYSYSINQSIATFAGDADGEFYDCSTESSRAYVNLLSDGRYCRY